MVGEHIEEIIEENNLGRREVDRLKEERRMAIENCYFSHELPMSIECIRDLAEYHSEVSLQFQQATIKRSHYLQKKIRGQNFKGLQGNYLSK